MHGTQALPIEAIALLNPQGRLRRLLFQIEDCQHHREAQLMRRVFHQLGIALRVADHLHHIRVVEYPGLLEQISRIADIVPLILLVNPLIDIRQVSSGHSKPYDSQHRRQHLLIQPRHIILEERLHLILQELLLLLRCRTLHVETLQLAGEAQDLRPVREGLVQIGQRLLLLIGRGIALLQEREHLAILRHPLLVFRHPIRKGQLLRLLTSDHPEASQAFVHADRILPVVGATGVFVGVLDAHLIARLHRLFPKRLLDAPHLDTRFVGILHQLMYAPRAEVTLRPSGETERHGIILLRIALQRDLRHITGLIGLVIDIIVGRAILAIGIDTEHREVAGVAGPHPVIGVTTKLAQ